MKEEQHSSNSKTGEERLVKPMNTLEGSIVPAEFIWLDGEMVPFAQATVHFLSPTLHYGMGVFEGVRCYATDRGPAVFRLKEHLERFLNAVRVLGIDDFRYDLEGLYDIVRRVIQANNLSECYIRLLLYFTGPLGLNLDVYRPAVGVAAWKWDAFLGKEAVEGGVRMMISSLTRMHPAAGMTKAKVSGQYVNAIVAKTMAVRAGFDDAIFLDPEGYVTGASGENLLLVRDGVLYTSPRAAILEGVTRDSVLTLAQDDGFEVIEEPLSHELLYYADEVIACGTAAQIIGVREIDYRPIGDGYVGPLTRRLQSLFLDTVHGKTPRSAEWLHYMVMEPVI